MQWHSVADGPDERTEVFEIANRGCLVRIVVLGGDGRWTTASVCWAPGLRRADFSATAAAPSPTPTAAAPPPATTPTPPAATAAETAPAPTPSAAPTPATPAATPAPAGDAEELVVLLRQYAAMRTAVVSAFRGKIGVSSGPIGFLDNLPQVGSFTVPGHGDWIWRVDPSMVTLRSKTRVIELPIPDHSRDDAFDPESVTGWLTGSGKQLVAHEGAAYPVDAGTIGQLIRRLEDAKQVRLFSTHPKAVYIVK